MFLETIFPPIPSEVIMPVAGVARRAGAARPCGGVIASGTAGAMLGNLFWYLVARVIGMKRFRPFIERYGRWLTMDWDDVEKAERLFGRFGGLIVSLGRMLPTIRSMVSIPAGLLNMRLKSFLIWSTLGTAVWTRDPGQRRLGPRHGVRRHREDARPAVDRDHRPDRRRLCLAPADLAQAASVTPSSRSKAGTSGREVSAGHPQGRRLSPAMTLQSGNSVSDTDLSKPLDLPAPSKLGV